MVHATGGGAPGLLDTGSHRNFVINGLPLEDVAPAHDAIAQRLGA
jgi:hypothetical protein